jgi:hypothetical protein
LRILAASVGGLNKWLAAQPKLNSSGYQLRNIAGDDRDAAGSVKSRLSASHHWRRQCRQPGRRDIPKVYSPVGSLQGWLQPGFVSPPGIDAPALTRAVSFECSTTTGAFVKNAAKTLPPGTSCGGIEGMTHAELTLQKGIYIFKNMDLVLDACSKVKVENGTVIYLTGTSSTINAASGAEVKIVAPNKSNSVAADSTHAYRGWAIQQDRTTTPTTENYISSGGNVNIIGGCYAPRQKLTVWANGGMNANSGHFPMITNTLYMSGNATLYVNLDYSATNLDEPIPLRQSSRVAVTQ